ncbi:conserved hypothetical protein [Flavobacterium sp. 9AF]|nr:conserved hypothetical protein [Flavobacterium sp. 9AF]
MLQNAPPALRSWGFFVTDIDKYTEKIERKSLTSEKNCKH